MFQFSFRKDELKVMLREPWNFNKSLIIFHYFDGKTSVEDYDFDCGLFSLQLNNVTMKYMNEKFGRTIISKAGIVQEVDAPKLSFC